MTVELLDTDLRWILFAVAMAAAALAFLLRARAKGTSVAAGGGTEPRPPKRRTEAVAAAAAALAIAALAALLIDRTIALIMQSQVRQGAELAANADSQGPFNEYRWVLLAPWGTAGQIFGAVAALVILVLAWRASTRIASPWRRAAVLGLRAGAVASALILFLEPAVELRQVAREPNRVAILVDDSQSMALREDPKGPSRQERARALIDSSEETFAAWRGPHILDFYTFSDELALASQKGVAAATPSGSGTLMRLALEQLRSRYRGRDLAGIVLISDGIATGDFAEEIDRGPSRDFLRSLETRIHTAWVGRPGLKDVSVARVLSDEFAFVRTVAKIKTVIRSTGYAKRRIPVTLSNEGVPLRQKWIDVGPGQSEVKVVFEFTPQRVGKYVYEVSTPVADDEAVSANNTRSFVVRVIRDKIRVLQVAGQPSWDVHQLRQMLKQNPNVDLISFFILRTQDDVSLVPNQELSLIPFPTHELFQNELPSFDVIFLQNFEYMPYGIGIYLDNIRKYVESGGGMAMIGGALSFSSGGYAGTPLAEAIPVRLPTRLRSPRDLLDTSMFRAQLTPKGRFHPITTLRYEPRDNLQAWAGLPELEGVNIVGPALEGATVLATHPRLRVRGHGRKARSEPMPVIVAGEYGRGRSLAVTTDSLWRWGFVAAGEPTGDGRYYDKFWENAIRWLIHDPELERLHVDSDAVEYTPESTPPRLDVRLLDRDYTPLAGGEVSLEIVRGANPKKTEKVAETRLTVGDAGDASYHLEPLPPGVYRVHAQAKVDDMPVEAKDIFLVREASREMDRVAAYDDKLQDIAAATGGRHFGRASVIPADLPFAAPRIVRVDRRSEVELWSRPVLLFLAFLFLGLEWLVRQRSGYL